VLKPRALRPGGRIGIVAPSSPCTREEFEAGVAEIEALGFEAAFDDRVFARQRYVAGPARTRAAAFRDALRDPSVDALVALRGGYGSVQLLPWLDAKEIRAARKPVVGYSDVTSLLTFVTQEAGLIAFHGPTVAGRLGGGTTRYDRATWLAALTRDEPLGELDAPALDVVRPGEAAGPLVGGTVSLLAASLGTPFAFAPPEGCILFLDEVNERPYRLDRLLTQLALSGALRHVAGVVFNELPGCDEPERQVTARDAVASVLGEFPGPVVIGLPSGHAVGAALTLPLGVRTRISASRIAARVIVEEAAVEASA
jgi:muramoyltetrapeptide carboxypeptidase